MKIHLLLLFSISVFFCSAQDTLNTSYYKKLGSNPISNAEKAKYVRYEILEGEVSSYLVLSMVDNNIITLKRFKGDRPTGKWISGFYMGNKYSSESMDYTFDLETYKKENQDVFYLTDTTKLGSDDRFELPVYDTDVNGLTVHIVQNIFYPPMALENDIQGKVWIHFVVDKKGIVTDIAILEGVDPLLDKAAIEVIGKLKDFKPGVLNSNNIRVGYIVPLNYVIG